MRDKVDRSISFAKDDGFIIDISSIGSISIYMYFSILSFFFSKQRLTSEKSEEKYFLY